MHLSFSFAATRVFVLQSARRLGLASLSSIALLFGACVSEPSAVTGKKQSFGYSWEQELQLGAEADKEITAEMGLYENPALQSYVEAIGQRVLQTSDFRESSTPELYRDTKFTFRVMDSPVVNAFALPGGYVYVTRGLLSHVQNEAQLAVVLGHEVAHVIARHSSQQARRAQIGQIGLLAGAVLGQAVLGDKVGDMGGLLNMGGQALELFMMRYSREAEHESDNLGVGYAKRAGYAAGESAKFFHSLQRISASEGKAVPSWQSTHPDPGDRANRVQEIAAKIPTATGAVAIVGEEEFLRRIEGIVVGDDPREGFTRGGVFYHPTLRFQFPVAQGWKLDNQKAAVVMADPNGRALMGLRLAPEARAREAAAKFVEGAKIQVIASGDTMINGLPATVIIGQAAIEQGTVGVWNAFIEMEGRVYSMMGYAPQQVFEQMRPTFETVAGGFSPLRDPNAVNVQPARLKLTRADRSAPFASFVPASLPNDLTAEAVAIMNQMELNQPVAPGQILKIPDTSGTWTPQQAPAAYPTYPNQPGTPYPQQPGYPGQTWPAQPQPGQPGQAYPPQSQPRQSYPPQSQPGYPGQTWPAQPQPGAPGQSYPAPPSYPQATYPPQPTYPPAQPGQPQNYPPPNWPR
jgi:predicted Zn-dependent protease